MVKKLCFGIALGLFFVYLSFRGVDPRGIADSLKGVRLSCIPPVFLLLVCIQTLRSYRWGVILKPIMSIDQGSLFSVTCVGFLAVVAIPARIGELARPYLISAKTGVSMSSAVGTILVERVFDGLSILAIFFVVVLLMPLPPWLIRGSLFFLLITLLFLVLMTLLILRREASLTFLDPLLRRLPERWRLRVVVMIHNLIDGFKIIPDIRSMGYVALLSIAIWVINATVMYIFFFAFGFDLPFAAALVLLIIIILGIAVPTAPGFVGNWHFFCILGLGLFGIHKADALAYAIVHHFLSISTVALLGIIFLPFNRFSLSDIKGRLSAGRDA